jgi:hypothetical protein
MDGHIKEFEQFKLAVRPLKELYGETRAAGFGPPQQSSMPAYAKNIRKGHGGIRP